MHPANQDLAAQVREQGIRQTVHQPISQAPSTHLPRIRSLQSEESWIDITSRNSSSSLSSAGGDDTITPSRGLGSTAFPRRRRLHRTYSAQTQTSNATYPTLVTDSSQEEYEESESEQDPLLTSSNEDIRPHQPSNAADASRQIRRVPSSGSSDAHMVSSNEAAGVYHSDRSSSSRLATSFHPQPNAFTHPPASRPANSYPSEPTNYFSPAAPMARAVSANAAVLPPSTDDRIGTSRPNARTSYSSNSTVRQRSHTPYNMLSPNHNVSVDHDAALRASLSTLLSCAAARRGLPKRDGTTAVAAHYQQAQQITQGTLCLIPESELVKDEMPTTSHAEPQLEQPAVVQSDETLPAVRPKPSRPRKSKSKSPSRLPHHKRQRSTNYLTTPSTADLDSSHLSPTTLWFLGVGALFLGGAVLFTAGYIQGKEVGYVEGLSDASVASCRSEVASDGLRGMGRRSWKSASIWGVS